MGLSAGSLDRRITVLRAQPKDTGMSRRPGEFKAWQTFWANRQDVSDGERVRAAQQGSEIDVRFVVRLSADTKTIGGGDRIQCEGQTYNVVGTKETGGRNVGIEISCQATRGATT